MLSIKLSSSSIEISASTEEEFDIAVSKADGLATVARNLGINLRGETTVSTIRQVTNGEKGNCEETYITKYGRTRITTIMQETLGLNGTREQQFEKLLQLRDSGAVEKTPTGYKLTTVTGSGATKVVTLPEIDLENPPE